MLGGALGDANGPLLNTDAPSERESDFPTLRFSQAARFPRFWLVQLEVAMVSGVTTLSYFETGPRGGQWARTYEHNFDCPACASIRGA